MGGFWMQECNQFTAGTLNRSFMDKAAAAIMRLFDLALNVICLVSHMVKTSPTAKKAVFTFWDSTVSSPSHGKPRIFS
jgi:hypothetical protein